MKRDFAVRQKLSGNTSRPTSLRRENAPTSIHLPISQAHDPQDHMNDDDSVITPRPTAIGMIRPAVTPGLAIGTATPFVNGNTSKAQNDSSSTAEEGTSLDKLMSRNSQHRSSTDRKSDYFPSSAEAKGPADDQNRGAVTPGDTSLEGATLAATQSPVDGEKDEKAKESRFGKSFRMKFPKKLGRTSTDVKPAPMDEKSEESDKSEDKEDRTLQDNLYGIIQKIRFEYEELLQNKFTTYLPSGITPSLVSETPKLHLPQYTTVIIQDERPDSGGVADLYRGTVRSVGYDADLIEKVAPTWLGDLLLRVRALLSRFDQTTNLNRIKCRQRKYPKFHLSYSPIKIFCQALRVLMGERLIDIFILLLQNPKFLLIYCQEFATKRKSDATSQEDTCLCRRENRNAR